MRAINHYRLDGDDPTILASGQAVVTSDRDPDEVAAELEKRLTDEVGLRTEVVVRTGAELRKIVRLLRKRLRKVLGEQRVRLNEGLRPRHRDGSSIDGLHIVDQLIRGVSEER